MRVSVRLELSSFDWLERFNTSTIHNGLLMRWLLDTDFAYHTCFRRCSLSQGSSCHMHMCELCPFSSTIRTCRQSDEPLAKASAKRTSTHTSLRMQPPARWTPQHPRPWSSSQKTISTAAPPNTNTGPSRPPNSPPSAKRRTSKPASASKPTSHGNAPSAQRTSTRQCK
jgi:hypothetical protein